ncbi:MAG: hypothetical protein J6334_03435 [Kiritimatiellae bacterium]|nr:hypothetical protein [Kiritimatiellia bacterium]
MRSGFRIIAGFFGWLGVVSAVFAESAPSADSLAAAYQRFRPLLLGSNTVIEQEGCLLIATAIRSNDEDFSREVLKERCVEQLAEWISANREIPVEIAPKVARRLTLQFLRVTGFIESLKGLACLDSRRLDGGFACVWGIPAETLRPQIPDWAEQCKALLNPSLFSHPGYPPLSVWEIAPDTSSTRLKEVAVNRIQSRYGYVCARFLANGVLTDYAPALAASLTREHLTRLTISQLFLLLGRLPGDPRLIAEIAARHRERGMNRAAEWFAAFGSLAFIDYAASQRCEQLLTGDTDRPVQMTAYPYPFELAPFRSCFEAADFSETPLEIFNRWRQPFPGGSNRQPDARDHAYAKGVAACKAAEPDFEAAYRAFLQSAGAHLTYEACHRAGLCAMQLDRPYEAIFLFAQAAVIKPYQRENWMRMAACCRLVGDTAAWESCVKHLPEREVEHETE